MSYDRPLNASDYPIRAVGPSLYRRTASSPIAVLPSRDLAADVAARLNATLAPSAPEPTQWPTRRALCRDDWRDGADNVLRGPPSPLSVDATRAALADSPTLQDALDGKVPGVSAVMASSYVTLTPEQLAEIRRGALQEQSIAYRTPDAR